MKGGNEGQAIDALTAEQIRPVELENQRTQQQVEEVLKCLRLSGEKVLRLAKVFREEMDRGLVDEPSSLHMQNTYVPQLPNGKEEGEFLALDLGGTNFRVVSIVFRQGKVAVERVNKYDICTELRVGCGVRLFDHIAHCLSDFVHQYNLQDKNLPLGFTFSFPMEQHALDIGVLTKWTKSFIASSVEGNDVVKMLREALDRRGDCAIDVVAILNDTTGTLVYGASIDEEARIGLVLGTGSNACYMERADRVTHWETAKHGEKEVIVNIEWGALGDNGLLDFIKTQFDQEVDRNSLIVNSFTFEKYIGGKYLGEVVRCVLVHLARRGLLFGGKVSPRLETPNSFTTNFVSHIEEDTVVGKSTETEKVLDSFDQRYTRDDLEVVKWVCEVVSLRAAVLVSSCISVLLKRINHASTSVAVDGSLFKHHPRFKSWMEKFISLLAPGYKFRLMLAEDGSAKGGALAAAIGLRLRAL